MRKAIAVVSATGALLFGGVGVADAATHGAAAASQSSATLAEGNSGDMQHDTGDNGKWGMFGLLGLFGLAGLRRRKAPDAAVGVGPSGARGHA